MANTGSIVYNPQFENHGSGPSEAISFLEPEKPPRTPEKSAEADPPEEDSQGYARSKWANKREYILSTMGYCVGVGNLWRFPYVCIRNGGGAFLIPFFLSLLLFGMPLFFLEAYLGQYTSRSPLHVWSICPLFKGVGVAMCILSLIVYWYYNTILAWAIYYLVSSCQKTVPWSLCDQWWNSPQCQVFSGSKNAQAEQMFTNGNDSLISSMNETGVSMASPTVVVEATTTLLNNLTSLPFNASNLTKNATVKMVSAAEEFWQYNVLQVSSGFGDMGHVVWYLALSLAVSSLLIFLGMIKGIKSSGKVVYVTAIAPYVIVTILLIRGVTLPGAVDGIIFYVRPDFSRLSDVAVWMEAALQVFWSLGPCWGTIIAMASYNQFNNNCLRDSIFLTLACEGTSFYAGFAIFSVLGYMARESGLRVDEVVSSGPGLAFIVYPEAVSLMPLPQLWAVLFFFMVITLCFDSEIAYGETLMTVVSDFFPRLMARYRVLLTAAFCAGGFLLQLPFVTQGGIYMFQLVDWYAAAITLILIGVIECIVVGWIYGAQHFGKDIMMMIGRRPPRIVTVLWCLITPSLLAVSVSP
ncbi:sodium- and chloride-dependent glycine transporter 2-like isoform X2 [Babylonia areolata]|uniref:sodium- and chloride-dependent glycine transporter 2-like isoform X2 n=1 Tax=Babylonia areolata TaxID=304850 RepID=UPI003FD0A8C3